ncbi:YciI family protein [Geminocystis sp. CENA526]|uniref:YciI family protein n=1 Tax=Geminocystis sp. CENA526 TaxID=1355871 RepID=UPI003D6F800F
MAWFVKIEKGIVNKEVFDRYVEDHIMYVKQLIADGHEAKTGYWAELGGGMLIFTANSRDEAESIVLNDPLVKNKCVEYELHQWQIVVG